MYVSILVSTQCNTLNAGRRYKCINCRTPRNENCLNPERLQFEFSQTPSVAVLVRGLGMSANEADVVVDGRRDA